MRIFKKNKKILIGALILSTIFASSCSAFFGDEGFVITSTSTTEDNNGNILLTLTFSGDEQKPMTITIPKGVSGKDGVGIKSVTPSIAGDKVKIVISYTDAKIEDTVIEYPVVHGKDGKGIENVIVGKDDKDNITIHFTYTDGTDSQLITIPKGENGNGIESITLSNYDNLTLVATYKILFTNGTETTFEVKNGKDGVSLQSISFDEKNSTLTHYCLKITYSDRYAESIMIPKPQSNGWLNGVTDNPDSTLGNNGDFYLNVVNGNVYLKENGVWNLKFSIKGDDSTKVEAATVLFRDEDNNGKLNVTSTEPVIKGKTLSIDLIPIPSKSQKKFLGRYSTLQNDKYSINAGKFTDLTPINVKTLNVYAWWE